MLLLAALCLVAAGCGGGRPAPAKQRRAGAAATRVTLTAPGATIPRSLLAGERPIGRGARFHPPARGPVLGRCTRPLGVRAQAHIEVFGAGRVVLLPAGIGTRPPRRQLGGRIIGAGCFGALVTLDPTGTVYFRPGSAPTLGDLFRSWGQALSGRQVASFHAPPVRVYVDGARWRHAVATLPLRERAEIVIESGPQVPPHARFSFPQAPSPDMR